MVSQLLFDDGLSDLIYADHPDYSGRAERDTRNGNDNVFRSDEVEAHIFDVEKVDGLLQASFTIGFDRIAACVEGPGGPFGGPLPDGPPRRND